MRTLAMFALVAAVLLLSLALFAGEPPNISGTWEGKIYLPNGNTDPVTLVFTKGADGYTGTCADQMGYTPEGTQLTNIKLADATLTFDVDTSENATVNFTLTVDADNMTGNWEDTIHGSNGSIEVSRKK